MAKENKPRVQIVHSPEDKQLSIALTQQAEIQYFEEINTLAQIYHGELISEIPKQDQTMYVYQFDTNKNAEFAFRNIRTLIKKTQ